MKFFKAIKDFFCNTFPVMINPKEVNKLVHHRDTTVGLYATDKNLVSKSFIENDAPDILNRYWNDREWRTHSLNYSNEFLKHGTSENFILWFAKKYLHEIKY